MSVKSVMAQERDRSERKDKKANERIKAYARQVKKLRGENNLLRHALSVNQRLIKDSLICDCGYLNPYKKDST